MKYKGTIISGASGSLGGMTFSHNRGGTYIRNRAIPNNPPTAPQTAARVRLTSLVNAWTTALSAAQRTAWNDYATANPVVDGQGNSVNIGGLGWFQKTNNLRLLCSLARIDDAPLVSGPAELTPPTITVTGASAITVAFTNTDAWAGSTSGALAVFASRGQSPTRISAAGIGLQFVGKILGAGTPPTSPQVLTSPFAYATGQRVFFRAVAVDDEGRVSADFRGDDIR